MEQNSAIEFLSKCTNEALRTYFGKMPDRGNVKAVAMDFTKRYKDLVHEFFPQAVVVVDKYHIARMADADRRQHGRYRRLRRDEGTGAPLRHVGRGHRAAGGLAGGAAGG
jgi:transposase